MPRAADRPREKARSERLWTKDFVFGTCTNLVLACNYFMLTVVMTAYAMDVYAAPASLAGFCASVFIIGTLFARLICPFLIARLGGKSILLVGIVAEGIFTALYLMDVPLPALMGLRLVHGFIYGCCSSTVATIVTSILPRSRKGEGIGYYMLSVTLGAAIGPFAGIILSRHFSYHLLFVAAAVIVMIALPFVACMSKRAAGKRTERSVEEATEEAAAFDIGAGEGAEREERAALREGSATAKAAHKGLGARVGRFLEIGAIPISLVSCIIFFGYSSLLSFLTPFAEEIGLTRAASVFFIVYAISMFFTRPFTGRAFDRRGERFVMIPAFFSFSIGMCVLALASNDWMILASALFLGYGVGTIQSSGLAVAVRDASDADIAKANATFYMLLDLGVGIGPLLLGTLVPLIGYVWLYLMMAVVGMGALALFLLVSRKRSAV